MDDQYGVEVPDPTPAWSNNGVSAELYSNWRHADVSSMIRKTLVMTAALRTFLL